MNLEAWMIHDINDDNDEPLAGDLKRTLSAFIIASGELLLRAMYLLSYLLKPVLRAVGAGTIYF
jgi:hypothetical protein